MSQKIISRKLQFEIMIRLLLMLSLFAACAYLARGEDSPASDNARLLAAVQAGQLDTVKELLKKGANPNADYGISLLSIAIGAGNPEMLEVLLKAGTKVDVPVPGPPPPLNVAMMASNGRVFDIMMATHPTPSHDNSEDFYYNLYSGLGANCGHLQLLDLKLNPKAGPALVEFERRLGVLKRAGFDINAADEKTGETILMEMVEDHVALPVLEKMVAAGANPTLRNKAGKSSADLAADAKEMDVLRYLDVDHSHAVLLREHEIPVDSHFVGDWSGDDDMQGLEMKADGSGFYASMAPFKVAWKQSGDVASLELVPMKGSLPTGTTLKGTAHLTPDGKILKLELIKTGSPTWTEELSRTHK
jgi:hypothetical protein